MLKYEVDDEGKAYLECKGNVNEIFGALCTEMHGILEDFDNHDKRLLCHQLIIYLLAESDTDIEEDTDDDEV